MLRSAIPGLSTCLTIAMSAVAVEGLYAQTAERSFGQRDARRRSDLGDSTSQRITVEMRLGTERDLPPLQVQRWVQVLEPLDIRPLSIGSADPRDELGVSEERTAGGRHLVVRGHIDSRSRLLVPGHTFTLSDRAAIADWIDELKRYGPRGSPEGKPLWGLSEAEFRRLYQQLSTPIGRSFSETPLVEVLEHCRRVSGVAITDRSGLAQARRTADARSTTSPSRPFAAAPSPRHTGPLVSLPDAGLSVGTSLAYLLSQHNRACRVEPTRDGPPRLVVLLRVACPDPWPVGWPTPKPPSRLAPKLMQFTPVELINAPADQVIAAVEANTDVPFLYDHAAIARRRIDLTKVTVNYVRKSTFWKSILDRAASLARLDAPLKTDEAGKPFVWITTASDGRTLPTPRRLRSSGPAQRSQRRQSTEEPSP